MDHTVYTSRGYRFSCRGLLNDGDYIAANEVMAEELDQSESQSFLQLLADYHFAGSVKYRMRHKSVNPKCITVYCSFNCFYKVISPTEIVQSDLHCYQDI
jgi:hypothetical protein